MRINRGQAGGREGKMVKSNRGGKSSIFFGFVSCFFVLSMAEQRDLYRQYRELPQLCLPTEITPETCIQQRSSNPLYTQYSSPIFDFTLRSSFALLNLCLLVLCKLRLRDHYFIFWCTFYWFTSLSNLFPIPMRVTLKTLAVCYLSRKPRLCLETEGLEAGQCFPATG